MSSKKVQCTCGKWFANAVLWQAHKAMTGH
jgi:hypothetical protein